MKSLHSLILITSFGLLAACSEGAPEPATETGVAADAAKQPPSNGAPIVDAPKPEELPTEVLADAIAAGSALGANGAVSAAKTRYGIGETVYASAPAGGHPAGSKFNVYWTYQDGTTHKEESKPLPPAAEYINFQFSSADGMKPGKYNVQIDFDFTPIGITEFTVN